MNNSNKKKPGRPKNEELVVRRRKQILEMAAKTFAQHGYPNTDVQTIADLLDIGKGTIYRYFSTKKELFFAAVERGMKCLSEKINHEISNIKDPLDKFTKAIYSYLSFFDEYPEYIELLVQQRAGFKDDNKPNYFGCISAHVEQWQELCKNVLEQHNTSNVSNERILDTVNDLVYGTIFTNYFSGRCKSFENQATDILNIILHGILPKNPNTL